MSAELEGAQLTVIDGKDDWLFLGRYDDVDVMGMHTDESSLDDAKLKQWARTLEFRQRWFAERDLPFFTLFVPETCLVYPDMLPDDIRLAARSPYDRLRERLSEQTAAAIVYPRDALNSGRAEGGDTYQKIDSHWTDWGAYIGYRALIQRVQERLPNTRVVGPADIVWRERKLFGPLGSLMTPERSCYAPVAKLRAKTAEAMDYIVTERRLNILTMQSAHTEGPVALVFRDSFATAMAPFLSESFSQTIYVSGHCLFYDLIERIKPDVVIYERAERALYHPPSEPDALDARACYDDLRLGAEAAISAQRRSRALLDEGKAHDALAMSDTALELAEAGAPGLARALAHRARIYRALGNPYAALECLRHSMTLEPDAGLTAASAAEVERSIGHTDRALALLRRATEVEPSIPRYWELRAETLLRSGDPDAALQCLEQAMQLDADSLQIHLLMSLALQKTDLERARQHALRTFELDQESHFIFANMASILVQQQNWSDARDVLHRAISRFPDDVEFPKYLELCEARLSEQSSELETQYAS